MQKHEHFYIVAKLFTFCIKFAFLHYVWYKSIKDTVSVDWFSDLNAIETLCEEAQI